jgi:tetratricopeptide (TPR) repeat protein
MNSWEYYICHAHTHLAQWQEALKWCHRSVEHAPYYFAYIDLAVAYAWLGKKQEASDAVQNILKMVPGYTVNKLATSDYSRNPTFMKEYEHIVEGARMAGLPEN